MDDNAGLDIKPPHIVIGAIARHDTDARSILGLKIDRGTACDRSTYIESDREVEKQGVFFCRGEIVHED